MHRPVLTAFSRQLSSQSRSLLRESRRPGAFNSRTRPSFPTERRESGSSTANQESASDLLSVRLGQRVDSADVSRPRGGRGYAVPRRRHTKARRRESVTRANLSAVMTLNCARPNRETSKEPRPCINGVSRLNGRLGTCRFSARASLLTDSSTFAHQLPFQPWGHTLSSERV
jgi:hypothetical protein